MRFRGVPWRGLLAAAAVVLALCVGFARGAGAAPFAAVTLNGSAFHRGDTITYQVTLTPDATPRQVDIYLGTLLPDGRTFLSLVQSSPGVISTAVGPAPIPFLANVPLTQTVVPFSYTFTGGEPVGTYVTHAIISTAGKPPVLWNRLDVAYQSFQFAVGGALNITSLSTNSAVPAQLLTIVGSGFDPTGDLRARFSSSSSGLHMDALPTDVTPTSITVSVPPLGGANGPVADVSVSVVQETGTAELISNSIGGFRIASLPSLTVAPGTVTIRILDVFTFLLPELKTQLLGLKTASGGAIDTAELRSALDDLATDEGALRDVIVAAMHDPTRADNVGTFRGIPLTLDQSALRAMDQLFGAYFLALGPTLSPPLPGASQAALIMEEPLLLSQSQTNTCDDIPARAQQMISEDVSNPVIGQVTAASHFSQAVGSCKSSGTVLKLATVGGGLSAVLALAAISGGVSLTPQVIAVLVYPQITAYTFVMINTANAVAQGHGTREDAENAAKALDSFLHKIVDTTLEGVLKFLSPQAGRLFSILMKLNSVRKATGVLLDQLEGSAPPPPPTPPVLSATPPALDFGSVTIGSSADGTFTVQNTGGGTLSGTASTNPPFSIVAGGTYNLTAGQTQTVTVRFSPTSGGTSVGNVTFTGGGGATRAVSGVGTAGLTLTCPASVQVGKTGTCTVTVDLPQNITTVPLSSSNAGVLTVPSSVTLFLANQNTSTFTITGVATGTATVTAGPVNGVTATATVKVQSGGPTLLDHTMTKVRPTSCTAPPRAPTFQTTATEADSWIRVTGAQPGDAVQWEWHRPDGSKYTTSTSNNTSLTGEACFWGWMYIAGHEPSTVPGTWSVRVLYNGNQLLAETFSIGPTGGEQWTGTFTGTMTSIYCPPGVTGVYAVSGTLTLQFAWPLVTLLDPNLVMPSRNILGGSFSTNETVAQQPPGCTMRATTASGQISTDSEVFSFPGPPNIQLFSTGAEFFPGTSYVAAEAINLQPTTITATTVLGNWSAPTNNGGGTFQLTKQ